MNPATMPISFCMIRLIVIWLCWVYGLNSVKIILLMKTC